MSYPNFSEEKKLWKKGYKFVVGLDEAGRGPLAGPVVAGAVMIRNSKSDLTPAGGFPVGFYRNSKQILISKIQMSKTLRVLDFGHLNFDIVSDFGFRASDLSVRDSKKLSAKQREYFYKILTRHPSVEWGVGVVSEKIIDKINILEATKLAMRKAVIALQKNGFQKNISYHISNDRGKNDARCFLLVDGNFGIRIAQSPALQSITRKRPSEYKYIPFKSIIRGDEKVFSIAAASIIAKVTRDRIMQKYHKKYPDYGFVLHKGYPTKAHFANLKKFGPCKIHRKSFHPIKIYGN